MTSRELELHLIKLDMTQTRFAQLMGYKPREVRYWIAGGHPIPVPVAILARLLMLGRITVTEIDNVRERKPLK